MLHTLYSNSPELLRAALVTGLRCDREEIETEAGRAFSRIDVVTPGDAVTQDIRRAVASLPSGICSGLRFLDIGTWFAPWGGHLVGTGMTGKSLEWTIWAILSDASFTARHPRLAAWTAGKSPGGVYRLAMRIAAVFSVYASYRLDWVLAWLAGDPFPSSGGERAAREAKVLAAHQDCAWQRDLWAELAKRGWDGAGILESVPETLARPGPACSRFLHIFMPRVLPPLVLPFLKKFAASSEIRIYLLNPCEGYWFDHVPKNLFDWKEPDPAAGLEYLRRNAASTRALIERVWTFASGPDTAAPLCEDDAAYAETAPGGTREIVRESLSRLDSLQLDRAADQQSYPVDTTARAGSLLGSFQRAVLHDDPGELDGAAADGSLAFVKAPGIAREVETVIDWIQEIFRRDGTVTPDDILVVTPDIDAAAPYVESAMSALPPGTRFACTIAGRSAIPGDSAARAVLDAGRFLVSKADAESFSRILSHPLVARFRGLGPGDAAIASRWLAAAGFRGGIDDAHVAELIAAGRAVDEGGRSDGTLMRALERLTAASLMHGGAANLFLDTLPAMGDGQEGFDTVTGREDLLETLTAFCGALAALRPEPADRPAAEWKDWAERLVAALFPGRRVPDDVIEMKRAIAEVASVATEALGDAPVGFEAFWLSVETRCRTSPSPARATGRVTFSGMAPFRGLPFRAIAFIGMDEGPAFPGTARSEEFDLTQAESSGLNTRRRGDRDSRSDNRCLFLDLLLAAREKVFISWDAGTSPAAEKNPSIVVQELRELLGRCGPGVIADATIKVPLSPWSSGNFSDDARMRSHRRDLCEALKKAEAAGWLADTPVFSEGVSLLPAAGQGSLPFLPFSDFAKFLTDTDRWSAKRAGIEKIEAEAGPSVPLEMPKDPLASSRRRKEILRELESGTSAVEIIHRLSKSPGLGVEALRGRWLADEISELEKAVSARNAAAAGLREVEKKDIRLALPGLSAAGVLLPAATLYENAGRPDEPLLLADISLSKSAEKRSRLRYVLLNAAGVSTRLWEAPAKEKEKKSSGRGRKAAGGRAAGTPSGPLDPIDRDCARRIMKCLMDLLDAHLGRVPLLGEQDRSNHSRDEGSRSSSLNLLWNGRDTGDPQKRRESLDNAFDAVFTAMSVSGSCQAEVSALEGIAAAIISQAGRQP